MEPPPDLIVDAVKAILLRVPHNDPARLLRAALVCKPWRRILTDPAFLRRYREFHGAPPLLGFIDNCASMAGKYPVPRFIPTTRGARSPFLPPALDLRGAWALDFRHGLLLLYVRGGAVAAEAEGERHLLVWDSATGDARRLRRPAGSHPQYYSAAVLCAAAGCDAEHHHLACPGGGGPFRVVLVWSGEDCDVTWGSVYSSETGAWSAATSVANGVRSSVVPTRGALVGNNAMTMCFALHSGSIVTYDLGDHRMSSIECTDMPAVHGAEAVPVRMEDGSLGVAAVVGTRLCLWSRNVDPNGVARWVRRRVISIEKMLGANRRSLADVIGFAEGVGVVFVRTAGGGAFTVELKSRKIRKIREPVKCDTVIPVMSFYTPDRTSSRLTLAATVADLAQKMSASLQISQP